MATTKFEVGKVYITMQDKFGDGEQAGKSAVIERTEGTVTFKHLASGEIFVREVSVFEMADVEGCDGYDDMDNFIADNFGEEIGTAEIESVEPVAEVETIESTAEVEKPTVEVCKGYDAKDIIAACYPVEIENRTVEEVNAGEYAVSVEAQEVAIQFEKLAAEVAKLQRQGATVLDAKIMADGTRCITTKGSKGVFRDDSVPESNDTDLSFIDDDNTASWLKNQAELAEFEKNNAENAVEDWEKESNAILERTVFAPLKNGRSIKLYKQGSTDFEDCIELLNCYTLTEKDAEIPRSFCSDDFEVGEEVTFTPINPEGMSHALAIYENKEQFKTVARKLGEAIQRGDKTFKFPTVEELKSTPVAVVLKKTYIARVYIDTEGVGTLKHDSDKEFDTAVAAYKYLHKKMMAYPEGVQAIHEIISDKENAVIFSESTGVAGGESTDAEIQSLIDAEIDAIIVNNELIACLEDYIVDIDAAAEVEKVNANTASDNKEPTIFDKAKLIDKLKAKVAEQRARPHKSIIDWAGTFAEMRITELFDLQKDFKKHLKFGEVELAENVFSMLKTLCRNYRAAA